MTLELLQVHGVGSGLRQSVLYSVDQSGVGQLMEIAVKGKSYRGIKLGICSEHGGDPSSVMFAIGLG